MENATIGKNLILYRQISSGVVTFSAGATALSTTSVTVSMPAWNPVSEHICTVRNNSTQNLVSVSVNNIRPIAGTTGVVFFLTTTSYASSVAKDVIVGGMFAGDASAVRLTFSLGSSATAAHTISADYQIWEYR